MHYPAAPVIRNDLLDENSDQNYVQAGKVKGKIKKNQKEVLKDSTNKVDAFQLKSMKQQVKAEKVTLEIDEEDSENDQLRSGDELSECQQEEQIQSEEKIENQSQKQQEDEKEEIQLVEKPVQNNQEIEEEDTKEDTEDAKEDIKEKENLSTSSPSQAKKQKKNKLLEIDFQESDDPESEISVEAQQTFRKSSNQPKFNEVEKEEKKEMPRSLTFQESSSEFEQQIQESQEKPIEQEEKNKEESQESENEKKQSALQNQAKPIILKDFEQSSGGEECLEEESDEDVINIREINSEKLLEMHEDYANTPIPKNCILSLVVKRDTKKEQYYLFDRKIMKTVLLVKKNSRFSYRVFKRDLTKNTKNIDIEVAKIKTNLWGTEFDCILTHKKEGEKMQTISINYETNILGLNGPRKMTVYVPSKANHIFGQSSLRELYASKKDSGDVEKFINKPPKWNEKICAYVLDFKQRATDSSVKNFLLVRDPTDKTQSLLFGKVKKDIFNLDIRYPFTLIQAAALAVSSFEKKLACE